MKYLVLLIVVVVAIGLWRSRRTIDTPSQTAAPALPQNMLACAHCGVHVPAAEALIEGDREFCCLEHMRRGPS